MTSMFLSPGQDPFAHLEAHLSEVPRAAFEGRWATVELMPDSFARQRYSVGVVVADRRGTFVFRLLDDLSAFEHLYGRDDVAMLRAMMETAEQSLLRASRERAALENLRFGVDAIDLSAFWPTAGDTMDAVLNRLFADVIPFLPQAERRGRDFATLDNTSVRRLVDEELKRIAGMDFERIVTYPLHDIANKASGESHRLEFSLAPPGKAGNVISAVYKTPDRVELNFLRASRDLATYARLRNIEGPLGVFVMRPANELLSAVDLDRLDNVLGEQSWNLEQQGFQVSTHSSARELAQDIWEWTGIGR